MSQLDDRLKSIRRQGPEFIPLGVGVLPSAWMKYREELDRIFARYPVIFGAVKTGERDYNNISNPTYAAGEHADAWGCVWSNIIAGHEAIVTRHPAPTRESVRTLKAPTADIGFPHGFMYLRLADLRGFEEFMLDVAEEPEELTILIDTVLGYNLRQAALRIATLKGFDEEPIVYFGDDLGMQTSLAMGPEKWRKLMKPCFTKIYKPFVDAGRYIYMHTDGHIHEIIPDLVECGVTVVNPQIRANGFDNLARVCKGKVCVDLDLDRQMFPFCTPADIDDHVREAVMKLGAPEGGLWLKAEIDEGIPLENIDAICAALVKYRSYFST